MTQFNLVAQLQMQGPANVDAVVRNIESKLKKIKVNVDVVLPQKANKALRQFNNNLLATNNILKQVAANARKTSTELSNIAPGVRNVNKEINKVEKSTKNASSQITNTSKNVKVATNAMYEFGHASALAVKRFAAFSIPAGVLVGVISNIKKGVASAIDFQRELIRVQQVVGKTSSGLRGLTDEIDTLSISFGVSSSELLSVSRTLAQTGLSAKNVKIAMAAIAKSDLSPTFSSMKETTEGAIAAMRQFNIESGKLETKLGSINAVAGSFAVESADIISAIRRTGGAFKAAGGSLEELIALFTSVRATTRESADSIATGFRTIFTRMQRPRTIRFLKEIGVNLQNLEGNFVGPYESVRRLGVALKNLDTRDIRFSRIIEELGGFRQVSKVIPLVQQFGISQQALASAMAGTKSLTEDAEIAQNSLAIQFQKVREEYEKLYRSIVESEGFKDLTGYIMDLAKSLTVVVKQLSEMAPLLTGIAAVKLASAIPQFGAGFISKTAPGSASTETTAAIGAAAMTSRSGASGGKIAAGGLILPAILTSTLVKSFDGVNEEGEKVQSVFSELADASLKLVLAFEGARAIGGLLSSMKGIRGIASGSLGQIVTGAPGPFKNPRLRAMDNLTKSLFGLSAIATASTGALAGLSAAAIYFGNAMQKNTEKMAKRARTEESLQKAISKQRTGGALTGVGTGALVGGVLGLQFGGLWGAAAGTLLGGGAGLGYGLYQSQEEEQRLRRLNIEERGNEAMENMSENLEKLLSGDVQITGSGQTRQLGENIGKFLSARNVARARGESEQVIAFNKQLKGSLKDLIQFKNMLVENVGSLEEFLSAANQGQVVLEAIAEAHGKTIGEITRQTKEEIRVTKEARVTAARQRETRIEFNNTTDVLKRFNSAITESAERMEKTSSQIEVSSALAGGGIGISSFTGVPGFGKFSRIAEGGITDLPAYNKALEQLLGGDFGQSRAGSAIFKRSQDMVTMLSKLPSILQDVAAESGLDKDKLSASFVSKAEQFKGLSGADFLINTLEQGIENLTTATGDAGGVGKFTELARSDPQKLLQLIGGEQLTGFAEQLDTISSRIIDGANSLDRALTARLNAQLKISRQAVKIEKLKLADVMKIVKLRTGQPMSLSAIQSARSNMVQSALTGTPSAGLSTIGGIGGRLREVNKQIEKENQARQIGQIFGGDALAKSADKLSKLNEESQKLRDALGLLSDTTDEAATIQKTLNQLEESKKARFSLAERYTFGGQEERVKILQAIKDVMYLSYNGNASVERVPEERRGEILNILRQFNDVKAAMFGPGKSGGFATGQERLGGIVGKRLPAFAQFAPGQKTAVETKQIDLLQTLFDRRVEAEQHLLDSLKDRNITITNTIKNELKDFVKLFVTQLEKVFGTKTAGQRKATIKEQSTLKTQHDSLEKVTGFIRDSLGDKDISQTAALKTIRTLSDKETIGKYSKQIAGFEAVSNIIRGRNGIGKFGGQSVSLEESGFKTRKDIEKAFISPFFAGARGEEPEKISKLLSPLFDTLSKLQINLLPGTREDIEKRFATEESKYDYFTPEGEFRKDYFEMFTGEILEQLRKSILDASQESLTGIAAKSGLEEKHEKGLRSLISSQSKLIEKFNKSLRGMDESSISGLGKQISLLGDKISDLSKALSGTKAVNRASGGPIFKSKGTDTIPAMLTPGEFVVNKNATSKNRSLLEAINGNKTTYAASGGPVGTDRIKLDDFQRKNWRMPGTKDEEISASEFFKTRKFTDDYFDMPLYSDDVAENIRARAGRARGTTIGGLLSLMPFGRGLQHVARSRKNKAFGAATGDDWARKDFKKYGGVYNLNRRHRVRHGIDNAFRKSGYDKSKAKKSILSDKNLFKQQMTNKEFKNFETIVDEELKMREKLRYYATKPESKSFSQLREEESVAAAQRVATAKKQIDSGKPKTIAHKRPRPNVKTMSPIEMMMKRDIAMTRLEKDEIDSLTTDETRVGTTDITSKEQEFSKPLLPTTTGFSQVGGGEKRAAYETRRAQKSPYQQMLSQRRTNYQNEMQRRRGVYQNKRETAKADFSRMGHREKGTTVIENEQMSNRVGGFSQAGNNITAGKTSGVSAICECKPSQELKSLFETTTDKFEEIFTNIPNELEPFSTILAESAAKFEASSATIEKMGTELPDKLSSTFENFNNQMSSSIDGLSSVSESFGNNISELSSLVTQMATASASISSAATELKDALAQEIKVEVTHNHTPITVNVEGGETSVQDGSAFEDMVMKAVGPELDKLVGRIRNAGFGLA